VAETEPDFRSESSAAKDLGNVLQGIVLLIGLYVGRYTSLFAASSVPPLASRWRWQRVLHYTLSGTEV
jgi:hypothetical protein